MTNSTQIRDLNSWQVESLRLTAFFHSTINPETVTWWKDTVGEEPDSTEIKSKQGLRHDQGAYNENNLILTARPDRIDWIYSCKFGEMPTGLPVMGSFGEGCQEFSELTQKWLPMSPPIVRLAFGAVLLLQTKDRNEGYSQLGDFLPSVELDPEGSYDFQYQINRPRVSNVYKENEIRINRLSKWSVVSMNRIQISIEGDQNVAQSIPDEGISACRLELDINTTQKNIEKLPQELLVPLCSELIGIGQEIAMNGDVK